MNLFERFRNLFAPNSEDHSSFASTIAQTSRKRKLFDEEEDFREPKRQRVLEPNSSSLFNGFTEWIMKKIMPSHADAAPHRLYLNDPVVPAKGFGAVSKPYKENENCVVLTDDEDDFKPTVSSTVNGKHPTGRFRVDQPVGNGKSMKSPAVNNTPMHLRSNSNNSSLHLRSNSKPVNRPNTTVKENGKKGMGLSSLFQVSKKDRKLPNPQTILNQINKLAEREEYRNMVFKRMNAPNPSLVSSISSRCSNAPQNSVGFTRRSPIFGSQSVHKSKLEACTASQLRQRCATSVHDRVVTLDDDSNSSSWASRPPPPLIRLDSYSGSSVVSSSKDRGSRSQSEEVSVVTLDSDDTAAEVSPKMSARQRKENRIKSPFSDSTVLENILQRYRSPRAEIDKQLEKGDMQLKILRENRDETDVNLERRLRRTLKIGLGVPWDEEEEEEEPEDHLPELTPEMEQKIKWALGRGNPTEILVQEFNIDVRRQDMATLRETTWLNDEIINYYLKMLVERGKSEKFPSVFAYDTHFFPGFAKNGYSRYRRWTKKVDIFAHEIILFPIHVSEVHWCLAVVDIKNKTISYYDSLGSDNNRCLNLLETYLKAEHQDKKGKPFDTEGWKKENVKKIPMQQNGSDCGMFTCKFADYISRRAPITFTQEHIPYFRRRMVFEILAKQLL